MRPLPTTNAKTATSNLPLRLSMPTYPFATQRGFARHFPDARLPSRHSVNEAVDHELIEDCSTRGVPVHQKSAWRIRSLASMGSSWTPLRRDAVQRRFPYNSGGIGYSRIFPVIEIPNQTIHRSPVYHALRYRHNRVIVAVSENRFLEKSLGAFPNS